MNIWWQLRVCWPVFRDFVFSFFLSSPVFFVRDFDCSFGMCLKACFLMMKAASKCD